MGKDRRRPQSIFVGQKFPTNDGGMVEVIEYNRYTSIRVRHMDEHRHECEVHGNQLQLGKVKNPYQRSVYGVGFLGIGEHLATKGRRNTTEYHLWNGMLQRCYDRKYQEKKPTYVGCTVAEEWHNFQNFAKWVKEQTRDEDCQLDKDLRYIGNKIYAPDTCSFVPRQINAILLTNNKIRGDLPIGVTAHHKKFRARLSKTLGTRVILGSYDTPEEAFEVYKEAKEKYIKEVANSYKDTLCPLVYTNLMNHTVSSTD